MADLSLYAWFSSLLEVDKPMFVWSVCWAAEGDGRGSRLWGGGGGGIHGCRYLNFSTID